MGQISMKMFENKAFIASDRWKCDKSPSEAHYWIVHSYQMTCKYCNYSKPVNTDRSDVPNPR